jgi:hypothetical protein
MQRWRPGSSGNRRARQKLWDSALTEALRIRRDGSGMTTKRSTSFTNFKNLVSIVERLMDRVAHANSQMVRARGLVVLRLVARNAPRVVGQFYFGRGRNSCKALSGRSMDKRSFRVFDFQPFTEKGVNRHAWFVPYGRKVAWSPYANRQGVLVAQTSGPSRRHAGAEGV